MPLVEETPLSWHRIALTCRESVAPADVRKSARYRSDPTRHGVRVGSIADLPPRRNLSPTRFWPVRRLSVQCRRSHALGLFARVREDPPPTAISSDWRSGSYDPEPGSPWPGTFGSGNSNSSGGEREMRPARAVRTDRLGWLGPVGRFPSASETSPGARRLIG